MEQLNFASEEKYRTLFIIKMKNKYETRRIFIHKKYTFEIKRFLSTERKVTIYIYQHTKDYKNKT